MNSNPSLDSLIFSGSPFLYHPTHSNLNHLHSLISYGHKPIGALCETVSFISVKFLDNLIDNFDDLSYRFGIVTDNIFDFIAGFYIPPLMTTVGLALPHLSPAVALQKLCLATDDPYLQNINRFKAFHLFPLARILVSVSPENPFSVMEPVYAYFYDNLLTPSLFYLAGLKSSQITFASLAYTLGFTS